ncbi:MAG: 16S rRNA (cytosine(1402)-N(4))-methyltransferase RsmH, partial [Planctomycetota bacterium]|nr:16S rRNA (cytosine(1402)-N(4))-methyltransferase RsmH [Planctomycetota bacterium]
MADSKVQTTVHVPVLSNEVLEGLQPKAGNVILDGTLGGGGHTQLIAEMVGKDGLVIGLDRDPKAIERCQLALKGQSVMIAQANFAEAPEVLQQLDIEQVDGILLDLGLSSDQLADHDRGFSFHSDGPLDLRFDKHSGEPAYRLVQRLRQDHLANLIYEFGEERLSRRIARKLVSLREEKELRTAKEIADAIYGCYPKSGRHRIHPATRTFQALRIAVNEELKS